MDETLKNSAVQFALSQYVGKFAQETNLEFMDVALLFTFLGIHLVESNKNIDQKQWLTIWENAKERLLQLPITEGEKP